jgi:hypothetical protein
MSTGYLPAAPPAPGGDTLTGWLRSLDVLLRIPAELRNEQVGRAVALEMLRCGEPILDELIASGLLHGGERGAELFDRFDLVNLSLYSGSGTSVPEETMKFALRWMHEHPSSLFRPRAWDYHVELSCDRPGGCPTGERDWLIARPQPEVYAGWTESLTVEPVCGDGIDLRSDGDPLLAKGVLVTNGEHREIRSARIREIVSEYPSADYRWARMPEQLQWQPEAVLSQGYAPCIAVTLDLAAKCRAAGFPARTRRGWIMGMLDLAHSWLEVVDEDGIVKAVDPAFAILADHHSERPHPEFTAACYGSPLNRLMPTGHEANNPIMGHTCGGAASTPKHRTMITSQDRQPTRPASDTSTRSGLSTHDDGGVTP